MSLTTRKMSGRHEQDLAAALDGRVTKGSGSTFRDQADGKQEYGSAAYVFAWDGKSTLGKSVSITREMWAKIVEQAHWALPALPVRFYRDERLTQVDLDLVAVELETFAQMQRDANAYRRVRDAGCLTGSHPFVRPDLVAGEMVMGTYPQCSACGIAPYEVER